MANASEIMKKVKKEFGSSIATVGNKEFVDVQRIPTGVFPFDLMSGGGFPMGKVSIVFGTESSGKTNLVLLAIAQAQRMFPDKVCVFIDVENGFDPVWATLLGVDVNRLIVINPEFAEQAIDITESFLYGSDVSFVGLDSIAALTTQNEIESSAGKMIVGGASMLTGKLLKKTTVSFQRLRNQGILPPAFVCINQIRHKIGVMFGDPETQPGGNAVRFIPSMIVRLYGKNILDKKINPVLPAYKETSVIMKKWKVPILAMKGDYTMLMLDHEGNPPGTVSDWNTVGAYLKDLGYLTKAEKTGGGWDMFGENYPTLDAARTFLYSDPDLLAEAKSTIIKELLEQGVIAPTEDSEVVEDEEVSL
jgi:recombination protein RecA